MIILDTNVLISAMLFSGKESQALIHAHRHEGIIFSPETAEEFLETSIRPKFQKYLEYEKRYVFAQALLVQSKEIIPTVSLSLCRDPKDNKFLSLAITADAEYLVTGDSDLLVLKKIGNTFIVTATDFLQRVL